MKIFRRRFLTHWVPLLLWMALIFFLSHQNQEESKRTSEWILQVLDWLKIDPKTLVRYGVPLIIRKLAHFTEYFILYLLAFRVITLYTTGNKALAYAFIFCVCYAATDEFHQTFIPGRVGQVLDVGIDATGALMALLFRKKLS